ncbi:MAG TPA: 50S ribosomal protein L11 methyltransferase [Burkholderiaceae bacterium]|nr:50S ribosomal protein L11 methyltransferase [Burkholderiaceae bacterium]
MVEITLTAVDAAEALADALLEHGALSVSIEDASAGTLHEQPLYGEPGFQPAQPAWARSTLRVLVEDDDADAMIEAACAATQSEATVETRVPVQSTDWVRQSQSQFPPTRISERLWIVPSWHAPPDKHALVVRLDPGIAFGTGTHPTTRLCLAWLDATLSPGASVLDYGCGSGILAIAAAKLGARTVVGVDIDPQALAAARENSRANGVDASYTDLHGFSQTAITFDVVVANILSNPLKLLAPLLAARVAPRGSLVLSGVLERQAEEVIAAYRSADTTLALSVWQSDDGWVCLVGSR